MARVGIGTGVGDFGEASGVGEAEGDRGRHVVERRGR